MSILDTFFLMFEGNSEGAKKAADEAIQAGEAASTAIVDLSEQVDEVSNALDGLNVDTSVDVSKELTEQTDQASKSVTALGTAVDETGKKAVDAHQEGIEAAKEHEQATDELAEGFNQAGVEVEELKRIWNESVAAISGKKLDEPVKELGKSADEAGKKVVDAHHKGTEAAHEHEHATGKVSEAYDKLKEHSHEALERIIEQTLEVIAVWKTLLGVEHLVENFFEQAERSDELGKQAKQLGINIEMMDAWGQAVIRSGGTAEGFNGSLAGLSANLERIATTGHSRALPFFKKLGIEVKDATGHVKSAFDLLPELAEKIEHLPKNESNSILRFMGLDNGTIRLLQGGKHEIDELLERQKKFGNITKEDAEAAEKFNDEWSDIKQLFRNIVVAGDTEILPFFYELLVGIENFIVFLREHKDLVVGFFVSLAIAVGIAAEAFGVFGGIVGIIFSPITLIIVGVLALSAAIAFLYDDIVNFGEGNNSVIGELAKRWPIIGEIFKGLIEIVRAFWLGLKSGAEEVNGWVNTAFDAIVKTVTSAVNKMAELFDWLWKKIGWIFEKMEGAPAALSKLLHLSGSSDDKAKSESNDASKNPWDNRPGWHPDLEAGKQALANTQTPLLAHTTASLENSAHTTVNNHVSVTSPITVNTAATDAAATGAAVRDALQHHYNEVIPNYADGVSH